MGKRAKDMKDKLKKIVFLGMTAVLFAKITDITDITVITVMSAPVWAEEAENTIKINEDETKGEQLKEVEHPRISIYNIREFSIVKDGEEKFDIRYEPADYKMSFDYWEITNPYDETMTVDTEKMYQMFQVVADFNLDEPIDVKDIDTGLKDTSTYFTVNFVNTVNDDTARKSEDADAKATILIGNTDENDNYYASVKGYEHTVYLLSKKSVNSLLELKSFNLILKIPALINIDTLEHVDMSIGKKTYSMKVEDGTYKFGKKTVKKERFTELYQALQSMILTSEMEETKDISDKEDVLTIIFYRNTKEAPKVTLRYYTYDGVYDSLEINGTKRFLVERDEVDTLIEQIKKAF